MQYYVFLSLALLFSPIRAVQESAVGIATYDDLSEVFMLLFSIKEDKNQTIPSPIERVKSQTSFDDQMIAEGMRESFEHDKRKSWERILKRRPSKLAIVPTNDSSEPIQLVVTSGRSFSLQAIMQSTKSNDNLDNQQQQQEE